MTIEKWAGLIKTLRESGIPVYDFPEDAARTLAAMARYTELRERPSDKLPDLKVDRDCASAIISRYDGKNIYLPQVDAFALLRSYGIPVARFARVDALDDLEVAVERVKFPCVLKVDSPSVIHKSEEGGVALGIKDQDGLIAAFGTMQRRFAGRNVSYVLQEQKPAGREVIIGSAACPGLGPLVMFGLGGVFVEVMKDVTFSLAPLTQAEARAMMKEIKGYRILEGARSEAGVDLNAIEDLLCRVSRLAADFPNIVEMDLNPIFVYPHGTPPVAVDVRVKVA